MMIRVEIPNFWVALMRFAYRRAVVGKRIPTGLPGHRDPENTCEFYDPRPELAPGPCAGDGHYLCVNCSMFRGYTREDETLDTTGEPGEPPSPQPDPGK